MKSRFCFIICKRLRIIFFVFLMIMVNLSLYLLHTLKPGVFIRCSCDNEVFAEQKALKYLPALMDEWNSIKRGKVFKYIEFEHPSLPVEFLAQAEIQEKRCDLIPSLFGILHNNQLWQESQIGQTKLMLFSAFLDLRDKTEGPLVRILAMSNSPSFSTPICHFYDSKNVTTLPIATKAIRVDYLHWQTPKADSWHPYIITCRAGGDDAFRGVVSVVSDHCSKPTNAMKIIHTETRQPKKALALCHKFLFNFSDFSPRLIEWIEACRSWGVDSVTFYVSTVHPNVLKVLHYYEEEGFLTIRQWTNPGTQINIPSLMRSLYDIQRYTLFTDENIPYTDCLLRHINTHEFVGVWDIDEFILPVEKLSLPAMIKSAFENWQTAHGDRLPPTSYVARTAYFFDEEILQTNYKVIKNASKTIPEWPPPSMHMLSHIKRTVKFTPPKVFTKSIHDTSRALGLHAHFALINLEGPVNREEDLYDLYPTQEAFLAHYRHECQGDIRDSQEDCVENFKIFQMEDTTMWKHYNQIYTNTKFAFQHLNIVE